MSNIRLSYVITTRNKLPYLKEVMKRLLKNIQADEEIIIADGASTDGTVSYLTELYQEGKIHQFISEPDRGEAHGYNKCLLMARGDLIKIITDDDAFYYPAIQECKAYMLDHNEVDVMSGRTAGASLENSNKIELLEECETNYRDWLENGTSVWFIGLPLMIRRRSLPFLGLFCTNLVQVDTEYSLRITSLHANIAWNTALIAIRIDNPSSNMRKIQKDGSSFDEYQRMFFFYDRKFRENIINLTKDKIKIRRILKKVFYVLKLRLNSSAKKDLKAKALISRQNDLKINHFAAIEEAFYNCDEFMRKYNNGEGEILCKRIDDL